MAEPLVAEVLISLDTGDPRGSVVPYPALPDVPHELVEHVSVGCYKRALLVLAHLRKNETLAQVGAGFGVSEATAWRYVDGTLEVLAAWAPSLHEALVGLGEGDSSSTAP